MSRTIIVGGHGMGDNCMAFSCARIAQEAGDDVTVFISTRDEIYEVIHHFFSKRFKVEKLNAEYTENHNLILNKDYVPQLQALGSRCDNFYYVIPDLTFKNPFAFPYKKYGVSMKGVYQTRALLGEGGVKKDQIYLATNSSTQNYTYSNIPELIEKLAKSLPGYTVTHPNLDNWAGVNLTKIAGKFPDNVRIIEQPNFLDCMKIMMESAYVICADNGPSHLAFHASKDRILLDPHWNREQVIVRWRQDLSDSIPIQTPPQFIVDIVKNNLETPQTTLLPKVMCHQQINWKERLLIKYAS